MLKFLKKHSATNFAKANSGVAAVEFAILLPFLLLILYGAFQVTTYVIAVRKIDNVTNDIGYILSREGQIATPDVNNVYNGGEATLQGVFQNAVPFLMYPYRYDPVNDPNFTTNSQIEVKFVGLPKFDVVGPTSPGGTPVPCPAGDSINRDRVRIMWDEKYPLSSGLPVGASTPTLALCSTATGSSTLCPQTCGSSPSDFLSVYGESTYGDRADIVFNGQSFILVNFAYRFSSLLGANFPGITTVLPERLEKVASYAVRSRWIDDNPADGIVEANEIKNYMQYCTDCNVYSSKYQPTSGTGAGMDQTGAPQSLRQTCLSPTAPANISTFSSNGGNNNTANSGGCTFF